MTAVEFPVHAQCAYISSDVSNVQYIIIYLYVINISCSVQFNGHRPQYVRSVTADASVNRKMSRRNVLYNMYARRASSDNPAGPRKN